MEEYQTFIFKLILVSNYKGDKMNILGKILMTVAIGIYSFIPPLADLATDTHVFHDGWLPHARMHTVWLLGVTSSVGMLALYLLWGRKQDPLFNINFAFVLSICVYGSFFLSAITTHLYGGALSDEHGGVGHHVLGIDVNVIAFSLATLLLCVGWALSKRVG